MLIFVVFFCAFFVLVSGFQSFAGPACPDNQSRVEVAEGFANIYNKDVNQARDMAIDAARLRVVRTLGVAVDQKSIYSMGLKIADWNQIITGGYIVDDKVVEESQKDGGYWVKLEAWIKCGPSKDEVTRQLLDNHKLLVLTDGPGSELVESELTPLLTAAGYRYLNADMIKANLSKETWGQLINCGLYDLDPEAYKFMADLVVYIRSNVKLTQKDANFKWHDGHADIRLFQISGDDRGVPEIYPPRKSSSKLVTLSIEKNSVQSLLSPANEHKNGFKKKIAQPLAHDFMEQLKNSKTLGTRGVAIDLILKNVPSDGAYHKFLDRLKSQRGVESGSLREISKNQGTYKVNIRYRLKSIYLAHLLTADKRLKLNGYSWNTIDLTCLDL